MIPVPTTTTAASAASVPARSSAKTSFSTTARAPRARREVAGELRDLVGQVDGGQVAVGGAHSRGDARLEQRRRDDLVDDLGRAARLRGRAGGTGADAPRHHGAVGGGDEDVGLVPPPSTATSGIRAVIGAHGRWSRLPARSKSVRRSARSYWPTSGCAAARRRRGPARRGSPRRGRAARSRRRAPRGRGCVVEGRDARTAVAPDGVDAARHLDDVVVGQERQGAVVADVAHVLAPSPLSSDDDQSDRRLGVERAAALVEQRRLLGQRRVGVHLEQLGLDRCDLGARVGLAAAPRTTSSWA